VITIDVSLDEPVEVELLIPLWPTLKISDCMVLFSSSLIAEAVDELSKRESFSALMKVIKDARTTVHINRQQ
jgi:hypothetical protein